jgi:4-hydroxy-2-oxoheptanedioate aldolase
VEGVDAMMFGAGDYMIDAALPLVLGGEPHPTFLASMGKFMAAAKTNNLPLFGPAQSPDMIPMLVQQGYSGIAVAFDAWGLAKLCADALKKGRDAVEESVKAQEA